MNYKIIKPEAIRSSMMNDDNMTKQFIEMYLAQTPLDFERLTQAVAQKDTEAIGRAAHHIKPTMAYIGADTFRLNFQELEDLARKKGDFDAINEKFAFIQTDFALLLTELRSFLAEL